MRRNREFPGVTHGPDQHGKIRYRLRRRIKGRRIDVQLPGPYGSTAFRAAYEAAIEGVRIETPRAEAGTIGFLVEAVLGSAKFRGLAEATKASKRARLDWIRKTVGAARYGSFLPRHVEALMEKKGGPEAANRLRKDLFALFKLAQRRYTFTGANPAASAEAHDVKPGGYHTWTDEEIETYRARHPSGSTARLALEVFLFTGAARQDAAALSRRSIRGGQVFYRRHKTGQEVELPIMPELARELAALPRTQLMLLAHGPARKGYEPESLGNWFRERCDEAGLPHCSAHGLRKAGARRLAEHGATEFQIMAFLAHRTAREASRYVAAANRTKLATAAMATLRVAPDLPNPSERLDNGGA